MMRAAIVGLGAWGKTLVESVHGHGDEIRFTLACTRTPAKVEDYCRERDIRLSSRYEEILAGRNIDAEGLATPNSQHETQIKQAAVTGRHIYADKPFTLNLAGARAAAEMVGRARHTRRRAEPALSPEHDRAHAARARG